ncbi:accessory Sec system protein Asp3 [Streptococcus mitis]|nr:accessory Sec system protein Asp3 [Streptococcus mitis]
MEMCLKRKLEKMKVFDFTYPDDTYTYQVSLLSAGFESLDFYSFSIEELNRV